MISTVHTAFRSLKNRKVYKLKKHSNSVLTTTEHSQLNIWSKSRYYLTTKELLGEKAKPRLPYFSVESLSTDETVTPFLTHIESSRKPASQDAYEKTTKSLQEKGFKTYEVETGEDALKLLETIIPQGSSIHNSASTTLYEIGYFDLDKASKGWKDLNLEIILETDRQKQKELRAKASLADYFITSALAVTEDGQLLVADGIGTKVGPISVASNTVFIVSLQKIVPNFDDAIQRLHNVAYVLENARMRRGNGMGSSITNALLLRCSNILKPESYHVVFIKNEIHGF